MSRYDWPRVPRTEQGGDDPRARGRFLRLPRTEFDPEGARAASRTPIGGVGGGPGPFAPASGRQYLWQPLGPVTVVHGQAIGDPRIAGRVNMLAVHTAGQRVYAASANGGVWYTNNGGTSWTSLGGFAVTSTGEITRPAQRHACGSIAVAFGATEANDIVYVGTGEVTHGRDAQPGHSLGGIGILVAEHPATSGGANPWIREAKNLIGEGVCRIAVQPGGTGVVAATTVGLFERPGGGGADNNWAKVTGSPFSSLIAKCSDVLWTRGDGGRPERLWVWVEEGSSAGLWVRAAGAANFTQVATTGASVARSVLAAAEPPDQIFLLNDGGPLLYRIASATAALPVATAVTAGVPDVLGTQGFYDIALAVHPTNNNRVVLGGSTFNTTAPDGTPMKQDAGVVVGDVGLNGAVLTFGHPTPFTVIGVGAHADVHDLVYSNGGNRLWTACDGGVFRSDKPAQQVGFVPVNDGLSVIESNYIANHPTCEGYVVAGLQDNGVIGRRSNGLWFHEGDGDGGGLAFDPILPKRYIRQFFNGNWGASEGPFTVPFTGDEPTRKKSAFYSMPASIGHRRGVAATDPPNVRQIIVPTSRVWYTEDFGTTWVTLPHGTAPAAGDLSQDDFGEKIRVCRWQSPDVAWILSEGILKRYSRTAGSDAAAGPGSWKADPIIKKSVKPKKDPTFADGPIKDSAVWTDVAVNLDPPPAAGQPPAQRGTLGSVYLGTIGNADNADVDTLWWFDGTTKWYPTRLRKDPDGVPAPVLAVACDPDHPDEVWVGTTVGVWLGVRTLHGVDPPTWKWEKRVNGLPEAAVEDLAIFSSGGLRLLRAGIASRGVWELRLDVADVTDLTYVRAHDDDLRYRARAIEKQRDLVTDRSWHGSPDVRPRRAPVARSAPSTLPWRRTTGGIDPELLRRFQSALRSRTGDPRVRATGAWDVYFNEVLRDLGAPLAASPPAPANTVSIDAAFWNTNMTAPHSTAEPWGAGLPSEADLVDFVAPLAEGDLGQALCTLPAGPLKVDILVHHRGLDPVDGTNVRVTLLRWIDPKTKNAAKWNDHTTWFAGNVPWAPAVNQVLNSADGKTVLALGPGWQFVLGSSSQSHRLTLAGQTIDTTHSGIATFDLNLTGVKKDRVVLLVAVIRVGTAPADDITLAPATLQDLALTSPNVAIRSMRMG